MKKLKTTYLIEWDWMQNTHSTGTLVAFALSKKEAQHYINSCTIPSEYKIIVVKRCE